MKATVIIDNISYGDLEGEWGLCIYIEYNNKKILLDTGASNLFFKNSEKLKIDLSDVDYAVLSHAHYDHSNGMEKFFEINKKANFYLQKNTSENCYYKKFIFKKYIGLPKNILKNYNERIEFVDGKFLLCDGVFLVPHRTPNLEEIGRRESMYQKRKCGWCPDDFSHEQSLVFKTEKGLIVFNSCSHGGAANIINEVSEAFPDEKVYGIIGGFHLFNKTDDEVKMFAKQVKNTGIEYVCTGHCTKDKAYEILKCELGKKLHKLHAGKVISF